MSLPGPAPVAATGFACGEVRGGNGTVHERVGLPGLQGILYSRPCVGAQGGDIHYLSICGSGLMARVCLADVAGHGETISAVGAEMHAHLRQSVDVVDERRVLTRFQDRLARREIRAMTTAVLATYYPPRHRLTVCYAGHPHGWLYRAEARRWHRLAVDVPEPTSRPAFVDLPVGTPFVSTYNRHRFRVAPGDRMLLVTDGVLDTVSPADEPFDRRGIEALLADQSASLDGLASRLLDALHEHADTERLAHDDVTFLLTEFVEGPPGPALWHVVRNRVLRR